MRFSWCRGAGLLVLTTLPWLVGCGNKPVATVTGKVTYQNGPVKGGQVIFAGSDGHSVIADIKEDGTYRAEKVPVGEAKIAVQTKALGVVASMPKSSLPPEKQKGRMSPEEAKRRYVAIPFNYETPETSGLSYTVVAGSQEHDLPLKGGLTPGGAGPGKAGGSSGGPPK
jgi:hypothetical protein